LLQLGCHPVAVFILHVNKTLNWLLLNLSWEGYMRSIWWQTWNLGNHLSICFSAQGNQEEPVPRWPVAGPSEYWLLASRFNFVSAHFKQQPPKSNVRTQRCVLFKLATGWFIYGAAKSSSNGTNNLYLPHGENHELIHLYNVKVEGKSFPLQVRNGPEGSRKLRFSDYMTTAQDGGKVVSLTHRRPLPSRNAPGTHFC